jgi:hypothetical protein
LAWHWPWQKRPRPPKVAGSRVPNRVVYIGFDRPHDYHFRFHGTGDALVFRGCVLVGFTTPSEDPYDVASPGEAWYDRWLVLKRPDGKLVYLPRNALLYMEEADDSENPRGI